MNWDEIDAVRAGDALIDWATEGWLVGSAIDRPVVLLIHGFTANGRYLERLATIANDNAFRSVIFNYNSHLGIDTAADSLATLLDRFSHALNKYGYVLVAHSMGGLVARYFAYHAKAALSGLKGIVLLGSPNRGTLSSALVTQMVKWGEKLTSPNPFAKNLACLSAQQLTGGDPQKLIENLNVLEARQPLALPILSVSGGRPFLEFTDLNGTKNSWTEVPENWFLQSLLNYKPNDGLVAENSADITSVIGRGNAQIGHFNTYPEYPRTNHSFLVRNYGLAYTIIDWIRGRISPASASSSLQAPQSP
jgi:pimeloyl-ACP methyl ester carboxylesterase